MNLFHHRLRTSLLISISVWVLSGCANLAEGPEYQQLVSAEEGEGVVYLYRANTIAASKAFPHVYVDEEEYGPLKHKGFIVLKLAEGPHTIVVKDGSFWESLSAEESWDIREKTVQLNVEAGQYYFYRLKPGIRSTSMGWRDADLASIPRSDAERELKQLRLQD